MPDLAGGFSTSDGGGAITIHRGNVGALWPYGALRGTEPPAFLPDARLFALPEPPDFLAAGDFDADGHWDIVAAHLGGTALYFLKGDGHGGFAEPRRIPVPGIVTAMTSGEINRPDGLTDLMVAVAGGAGPQVLVFEWPDGALRGKPEAFSLPAAASALAVIPLDGGLMNGLAIAAGHDLLLIQGRDRKLTRSKADRESVPEAAVTRQTFPFALKSLAVGHFTSSTADLAALGDDGQIHILERCDARQPIRRTKPRPKTAGMNLRTSIALPIGSMANKLVTARVAATGRDSLIVLDPTGHKLHVVSHRDRSDALSLGVSASLDVPGAPAALEPMRINKDALHDLVVLADSGTEPVVYATAADNIIVVTNTSDDAAKTGSLRNAIVVAGLYEGVQETSEIDFNIPLTDPDRDPTTGAFTIQPVYQNELEALPNLTAMTIDGYTQPGSSPNTLANGDNARPLINISGGMAGQGPCGLALFGGDTLVRGVVLTGFTGVPDTTNPKELDGGCGIDIESDNNIIEGNFVGIGAGGTVKEQNSTGFFTMQNDYGENGSTIGGTVPAARNLISGNNSAGIQASQMAWANTFFIEGNYIGTDRTGTQIVPNGLAGVLLAGAFNCVIGGTSAGAGNLMSGNYWYNVGSAVGGEGPFLNLIQGNLIGTDLTGTVQIEPFGLPVWGISLSGTSSDTIGGTTPAARNIISGNRQGGIWAAAGSEDLVIQGNYIGLDVTGTQALPNSKGGVLFAADWTDIWNTFHTGTPISNTTIGGAAAGAGNVISGNDGPGISIIGLTNVNTTEALANAIAGNLIGTDAAGVNALGNQGDGIVFQSYAGGNTIGGTDAGAGNAIAYNTGNGVNINPGANSGITNNSVIGNVVYSNTGAG